MDRNTRALLIDLMGYALLVAVSAFAGMHYERARQAQLNYQELHAANQRAANHAEWLAQERKKSEDTLNARIATLQSDLLKAQTHANAVHQNFVASVRTGAVSMRAPVVPTSCTSQLIQSPTAATAGPAATTAQLEPEAAADLADIAHDGNTAIRDLNTCIAKYNTARQRIEDWRDTLKAMDESHAQTP